MATPSEFRNFCAHIDCGPGLFALAGAGYVQIGSTGNLRRLSLQPRPIICVAHVARVRDGERMLRRLLRTQGWPLDQEGRVYAGPRAVASCVRLVHRLQRGHGFYTATDIERVAPVAPVAPIAPADSPLHGLHGLHGLHELHDLPVFRRVLDNVAADSPLHGLHGFHGLHELHDLPTFRRVLNEIGTDSPLHGLPTFRRVLDDVGTDSRGSPTFRRVLDDADSPASTLLDSP